VNKHPVYREIGKRIQRWRKAKDMKQQTLAKELGISRGSLANIETGKQSVLVHQIYNFARVLKVKPHDFLPESGGELSSAPTMVLSQPTNITLSPDQQRQIANVLSSAGVVATPKKKINHAKDKR
jgi:transcriptional regulator with XRE-family HTH domain